MIVAILGTGTVFLGSLPLLGEYMDLPYLITPGFVWRVVLILGISLGPIYAAKIIGRKIRPPTYRKVMHI